MGSDATLRIPIVDLSDGNLKPGTHAWAAALLQIRSALEFYGCFEVMSGGVTPELREATFGATKELFALPVEAKKRYVSDGVYRGYMEQVPGLPCESMAVDGMVDPAAARGFTHLMWPEGNPSFCETVGNFAKKACELDRMVRRMVLESLGVDKHYDSHLESTKYVLRFSEYAPPAGPVEDGVQLALPTHVDTKVCTLIYENQVHGLEVQARSGDWVPFMPSSPDAVIFLIGDAFCAWSNDRLFCPPHRVRVRPGETRCSVMLCAVPKPEAVIEAPEELVDEGCPPRFRPYRYPDYMKFLAASPVGGYADLTSLLTFCGTSAAGEQRVQG